MGGQATSTTRGAEDTASFVDGHAICKEGAAGISAIAVFGSAQKLLSETVTGISATAIADLKLQWAQKLVKESHLRVTVLEDLAMNATSKDLTDCFATTAAWLGDDGKTATWKANLAETAKVPTLLNAPKETLMKIEDVAIDKVTQQIVDKFTELKKLAGLFDRKQPELVEESQARVKFLKVLLVEWLLVAAITSTRGKPEKRTVTQSIQKKLSKYPEAYQKYVHKGLQAAADKMLIEANPN